LRGNFEVLKNDYNKQQQIDVSIPEEYEEEAYIRVQIISSIIEILSKKKSNNQIFQTTQNKKFLMLNIQYFKLKIIHLQYQIIFHGINSLKMHKIQFMLKSCLIK
jgi:hypothetical protein